MAGVSKQSEMFKKYGAKLDAAVKQHANDATDYGPQRLPGGITNGIAKLDKCLFFKVAEGKQNAGEWCFQAIGIVAEPFSAKNKKGQEEQVMGRQTSILEMVCDTATQGGKVTTQAEHVENILNEMRKLAGPDFTAGKGGADLEDMAAVLQDAHPFFRFTTQWKKPYLDKQTKKMVEGEGAWENWHGSKGLEDYQPPVIDDVQDDTEQATPPTQTNGQAAKPQHDVATKPPSAPPKPPTRTATAAAPQTPKKSPADEFKEAEEAAIAEQGGEVELPDDVAELVAMASDGDHPTFEEAQNKLTQLAVAKGWAEEQVDKAQSWEEVAGMIAADGQEETNGLEHEPDELKPPQVGETWNWKVVVVDKATKQRTVAKVATPHEVTSVDEDKQTVGLRSSANPKLAWRGIPFAQLERA